MIIAGEEEGGNHEPQAHAVHTSKRQILPRSSQQAVYVDAVDQSDGFGLGPAGTGKTYLAVAKAVESLVKGNRSHYPVPTCRGSGATGLPARRYAGMDPICVLYMTHCDMLPANQVAKKMENGEIEIASPLCAGGRLPTHSSF